MDAIISCFDALEIFRSLGTKAVRTIVSEIAMLGRSGFDSNDASRKYELRSLAGDFSGLHLVSLLYAGLRQLNLDTSVGMDLSREYEAAKTLLDSKSGS